MVNGRITKHIRNLGNAVFSAFDKTFCLFDFEHNKIVDNAYLGMLFPFFTQVRFAHVELFAQIVKRESAIHVVAHIAFDKLYKRIGHNKIR